MTDFQADDLSAVREEGSLVALFTQLSGKTLPKHLDLEPSAALEPEPVPYHIPRKGAWPCGTAPSGPTPPPCDDCANERTTR
ncbi:hypothetical protein [Streptomyces aureus]